MPKCGAIWMKEIALKLKKKNGPKVKGSGKNTGQYGLLLYGMFWPGC